ncbi:MAG: MFS transporter [Clostridiaceae bacterium]|jgi:MFS family permease|nr:MFS transporter [Clostridiaceae bacterium]
MKRLKNRDLAAMFLILEGVVYTTVFNLYNPFIQMFAKRMGGNDLHTALLNAAPPLVAIFTLIPFGMLIERINKKKHTILVLLSIVGVFYAAISLVPQIPHESKVFVYVILIGFMNGPGSLYLTTWQSYFADNFKGTYASRVYTIRSKYSSLFGLLTVLGTGLMLTYIPKSDDERLVLYQIFYGLCFALTLLQIFFFSRVKVHKERHHDERGNEHRIQPAKRSRLFSRETFGTIVRNKPFVILCICGFFYHFTWQMAWPVFFIYNTGYAHLNELQLAALSFASGAAQFLSFSLWNKFLAKRGNSFGVFIAAFGVALSPLPYVMLLNFPLLVMANILTGFALAGLNLTLFLNLLDTLPEDNKTIHISLFNTLTSITGFIAPMVGLWIYGQTSIFLTMGIATAARLTASMGYFLRWRSQKKIKSSDNGDNSIGDKSKASEVN